MRTCIFRCQSVKDKQQNRQKLFFKSINPCPPKGAAISVYPSGGGSGLGTCSRRLACSIIFKFTFSCSQASGSMVQVFFRYHSFTLYILSTRHPIAASSTRAAIVSVSTILSPSYSCNKKRNRLLYSVSAADRKELPFTAKTYPIRALFIPQDRQAP